MKKLLIPAAVLTFLTLSVSLTFAEKTEIEKQLRTSRPYIDSQDGRVYADASAEYSPVRIAGRDLHWEEYSTRLMKRVGRHLPYTEFRLYERDRRRDESITAGSYFIFDNRNIQPEIGFGIDTDYMYRFQTGIRYEERIKGSLYAKLGETYFHYESGDVLSNSLGMIYYRGNHSLSADYLLSITESRRDAHSAIVRGNFALPFNFDLRLGIAAGERLFDVDKLDASKQGGWLFFTGIDYRLTDRIKIGFDYSYGEENQPKFLKQGFNGHVSVRF
ncbi:MAG: hypothetical protein FGM27_08450 [Candidatus Omnitrophica bacterium]|nr:hypothetical protein [Candidatus Omnitrophota bacterium]